MDIGAIANGGLKKAQKKMKEEMEETGAADIFKEMEDKKNRISKENILNAGNPYNYNQSSGPVNIPPMTSEIAPRINAIQDDASKNIIGNQIASERKSTGESLAEARQSILDYEPPENRARKKQTDEYKKKSLEEWMGENLKDETKAGKWIRRFAEGIAGASAGLQGKEFTGLEAQLKNGWIARNKADEDKALEAKYEGLGKAADEEGDFNRKQQDVINSSIDKGLSANIESGKRGTDYTIDDLMKDKDFQRQWAAADKTNRDMIGQAYINGQLSKDQALAIMEAQTYFKSDEMRNIMSIMTDIKASDAAKIGFLKSLIEDGPIKMSTDGINAIMGIIKTFAGGGAK